MGIDTYVQLTKKILYLLYVVHILIPFTYCIYSIFCRKYTWLVHATYCKDCKKLLIYMEHEKVKQPGLIYAKHLPATQREEKLKQRKKRLEFDVFIYLL